MLRYFRNIFIILFASRLKRKWEVAWVYVKVIFIAHVQRLRPSVDNPIYLWALGTRMTIYSFPETLFLLQEIFVDQVYRSENQPKRILDLGSNIGWSALYFISQYKPDFLVLVEPQALAVDALKRSFGENNGIEIVEGAVSTKDLKVGLKSNVIKGAGIHTKVFELGQNDVVEVKQIAMDKEWLDDFDLVKMDVEGMELRVLQESFAHKDQLRTKEWIVEVHSKVFGEVTQKVAPLWITHDYESQINKTESGGMLRLLKK